MTEIVIAVLPSGDLVRLELAERALFDAATDRWRDAVDRALAGEGEPAAIEEVGRVFFMAHDVTLYERRGGAR
jgi:hypothetical protein